MVSSVSDELRVKNQELRIDVVTPELNIYGPLWKESVRRNYYNLGLRAQNIGADYVWTHDWGGIIALRALKKNRNTKVIWTVHSPIDTNYAYEYGYGYEDEEEKIDWGDAFFDFGALVREGVERADIVTTVSPTFAAKLNRMEMFAGKKVIGISNGTEGEERIKNLELRIKNDSKRKLQELFGLAIVDVPVFCFVSRMVSQKGVALLLRVLPKILKEKEMQMVWLGKGEKKLMEGVARLEARFPGKVAAKLTADFDLPKQIYAGADFLVLPSVAEPFGIVVAEAKKYHCVPIVHLVDGLVDQVTDGENGLGFEKYSELALEKKIREAIEVWENKNQHRLWSRSVRTWDQVARDWMDCFVEYSSQ